MIGNSFKVGIYIRLSRDDGNIESDSIISQRSLLNQYIKDNNYNLIDEFLSLENPTRELIINLVEKIYIYQDRTIDIIFTFKNVT